MSKAILDIRGWMRLVYPDKPIALFGGERIRLPGKISPQRAQKMEDTFARNDNDPQC